jgi:hypothetical protein
MGLAEVEKRGSAERKKEREGRNCRANPVQIQFYSGGCDRI